MIQKPVRTCKSTSERHERCRAPVPMLYLCLTACFPFHTFPEVYNGTEAQHSSHRDVDASLASLILRYLEKCLGLVGLTEAPQLPQPRAYDRDK